MADTEQFQTADNHPTEDGQAEASTMGVDTATHAAATAAQHMTSQAGSLMQQGFRTFVEFNRPAVEMAQDQGRRTAEAVTRLTGACHKTAEHTVDGIHALMMAYARLGCGMHELQHACAALARRSTDQMVKGQQAFLGCRSAADLAEAQQNFYRDMLSFTIEASSELLQTRINVAQSTIGPLKTRVEQHTDHR